MRSTVGKSSALVGGVVNSTVSLLNGSVWPKNHRFPELIEPYAASYDPIGHCLLLSGYDSSNIVSVNATSGALLSAVALSGGAPTITVDTNAKRVYAPEASANVVGVLNASSLSLMVNLTNVGSGPSAISVDPTNGELFVTDSSGGMVTILNGSNYQKIKQLATGRDPEEVVYDPVSRMMVVANGGSNNVTLINATTNLFTRSTTVGLTPLGISVDPNSGFIYVNDEVSNNVSVLSGNGTPIGNLNLGPAGTYPTFSVLDSSRERLYVAEGGGNQIGVIDILSLSILGNFSTGFQPEGISFDPVAQSVVTANSLSDSLTLLNLTDNVSRSVPVGTAPDALTVDNATGEVLTAESTQNALGAFSSLSNPPLRSVAVGSNPSAVGIDPTRGLVYVANNASGNVTVLDPTLGSPLTSINLGNGGPDAVVVDPDTGRAFVAEYDSDNVSVISTSTLRSISSVSVGLHPVALSWSPADGRIYVANQGSGNVSVLSGANGTLLATVPVGDGPNAMAYDPLGSMVYVSDQGSHQITAIAAGASSVVSTWNVSMGLSALQADPETGALYATSAPGNVLLAYNVSSKTLIGSIPVGLAPEAIGFSSNTDTLVVGNYGSGTLSIVVPFRLPVLSPVTFYESGLPSTVPWSVTVEGTQRTTNTSSLTFEVLNGTIPFRVAAPPGFTAFPGSGSIIVTGTPRTQLVTFALVSPAQFTLTVTQVGLPTGIPWRINISGHVATSAGTNLSLLLSNGSYSFNVGGGTGFTAVPASGVILIQGRPAFLNLTFTKNQSPRLPNFAVVFVETGLPSGSTWSVHFGNVSMSGTNTSFTFFASNGTYTYQVTSSDSTPTPDTGSIRVNGAGATIHVTFATPSNSVLLTLAVVVPVTLALLGVWVFLLRRRDRTNQAQRGGTTGRNGDVQSPGDVGSAEELSPPIDPLPTSDSHASLPEKLTMSGDYGPPRVRQDDGTFGSVSDGSGLDEPDEPQSLPSERACSSCGTLLVEERCRECGYSASGETNGLGSGGSF